MIVTPVKAVYVPELKRPVRVMRTLDDIRKWFWDFVEKKSATEC